MEYQAFTFDESKFSSILKKAIENQEVVFRDGVAYWKKGLEKTGIIQHIPLKPVDMVSKDTFVNTLGSLQSSLQNTMVAVQAISTGTLLVATIIQTQILSKKIDAVRNAVIQVSQIAHEQNILFYTDKVSEYLSVVQNLQLILRSKEDGRAIEQLGNATLANSMQLKNQISFFILNLLSLVQNKEIKDDQHLGLILKFIQQIMEILPLGMHLEHILSHRLGQYQFSQNLIEDSAKKYAVLLDNYRGYLNFTNNKIKNFEIKAEDVPYFMQIKQPALDLISNRLHVELLEKPAKEALSIGYSEQPVLVNW